MYTVTEAVRILDNMSCIRRTHNNNILSWVVGRRSINSKYYDRYFILVYSREGATKGQYNRVASFRFYLPYARIHTSFENFLDRLGPEEQAEFLFHLDLFTQGA
jgi:hypothetical protein